MVKDKKGAKVNKISAKGEKEKFISTRTADAEAKSSEKPSKKTVGKSVEKPADPVKKESVPTAESIINAAFGSLRVGNSPLQTVNAITAAELYVQKILGSPSNKEYWRISTNDPDYVKNIGRLFGGSKIMFALGFVIEENGTILAVRDPNGRKWDTIPVDVRKSMMQRMQLLKTHAKEINTADRNLSGIFLMF